jgi:hypothetical protein
MPQLNPWFFGADYLPGQKGGARRRLLDTAAFLHDVQDRFYGRFVKAIRDAGYRGPLNRSRESFEASAELAELPIAL